jgi:acyl-CoA thioesterase I
MKKYALRSLILLVALCGAAAAEADTTREDLERTIYAQQVLLRDWAGLTRYGSDNAELRSKPGENRVVFIGDEITEKWGQEGFFAGKPYVNRGIAGQASPQMLVRFRQDVIDLEPKVVVIQASSNDIAGSAGPMTERMSGENLMSMIDLAKAHGIRVVLASVTPVCDCTRPVTKIRSPVRIMGLNSWLKEYAAKSGAVYLDWYSALAEGRNMKKDLTADGVLPNRAGYQRLAELTERAIAEALSGRR